MRKLQISLFGKLRVRLDDVPLTTLGAQKVQELLAYLVIHRLQPRTREQLAAVLWSDSDAAQGRKYLRQALWQLQSGVQENDQEPCDLLVLDGEYVQLCTSPNLHLDVERFEHAFLQVRGRPGPTLDPEAVTALDSVLPLYRGDLLEGWYQEWCIIERERLQNIYLLLLDKLMGYCEAYGLHEAGLLYGDRILRCDYARERTHRRLMRLRYLAGDRTGALRQYERCRDALRAELDVAPSRSTDVLLENIRHDRQEAVITHFGDEPPPETPHDLQALLDRLHTLQLHLRQTQEEIDENISALRSTLTDEDGDAFQGTGL